MTPTLSRKMRLDADPDLVRSRVRQALAARRHPAEVSVRIEEGAAVLSGSVICWEDQWAAEYAAWSTPGVEVVVNRIEVAR
ncbi:MAG TPA: BON domain-containing protein [Thermoanaerobaculia bacterium]|nr:BON domain-containing protein [Thermoanaerobaculia bacterium]